MEKQIYIHYGHIMFDPSEFEAPENVPLFSKPRGGLWGSPIDAKFGWKQWYKRENFADCTGENSFQFCLSDAARVFHIRSVEDAKQIPKQEVPFPTVMKIIPDFEQMVSEGWDAVELHLSEEPPSDYFSGLYFNLYGWDCDSIVVLNKDVIIPL